MSPRWSPVPTSPQRPRPSPSPPSSAGPPSPGSLRSPPRPSSPGGQTSGARLGTNPINGLIPPFAGQPVQGFSGILPRGGGVYDMLSDNGFGKKDNSADFLLRVQRVRATR
ncbi:hypothetical protein [Rhizohabitans arisaemae]|uniref:hypothetical protein n=1 Tax=Rhizohabitans arisaemae TaxID=2720610 RepID=UPI0024B1A8E4|nr:hypothetical protein [Rhizohabitans arisaemae]